MDVAEVSPQSDMLTAKRCDARPTGSALGECGNQKLVAENELLQYI
jgi:hypothetical protein